MPPRSTNTCPHALPLPPSPVRSYVGASYVKWVEAAGGRVVPIRFYASDAELRRLFNSVNGLIFPVRHRAHAWGTHGTQHPPLLLGGGAAALGATAVLSYGSGAAARVPSVTPHAGE